MSKCKNAILLAVGSFCQNLNSVYCRLGAAENKEDVGEDFVPFPLKAKDETHCYKIIIKKKKVEIMFGK